jgi:hypothetical protein
MLSRAAWASWRLAGRVVALGAVDISVVIGGERVRGGFSSVTIALAGGRSLGAVGLPGLVWDR